MWQKSKANWGRILLWVLFIATLAFIWIHSCMGQDDSQQESLSVLALLKPMLEVLFGKGNVTDHLVRKLAHFTEFAILGLELNFLWGFSWKKLGEAAMCGWLAAFIDETIQIFSGRGPMIADVWIDFGGVCTGIIAASFLHFLVLRMKEKSKNKGLSQ